MGRTERELQQASEHVKYEIEMLEATAALLARSDEATDQATRKAWLESFVLHARNLIDFLYPTRKPQPDDILSDHYVDRLTDWEGDRPRKTALLEETKKRADKLAAHLTCMRGVVDMNWQPARISADIEAALICFRNHLPPDRKAWFAVAEKGPTGPTGAASPPEVRITTGPFGPPTTGGPAPSAASGATGPAGPPSFGEPTGRK